VPYCGIAYEAAPTSAPRSSWLCDRAWSPRWRGCARRMRTCPCGSPAQARCGSVESASRPRMLRTGYFAVGCFMRLRALRHYEHRSASLARDSRMRPMPRRQSTTSAGGRSSMLALSSSFSAHAPGLPRTAVVPISLSPQFVAGHTRVVPSFYQLRGLMSMHNPLGLNPEVTAILSFPMRHWAFRDCYACFVVQLAPSFRFHVS
jgi:hypothetical protein